MGSPAKPRGEAKPTVQAKTPPAHGGPPDGPQPEFNLYKLCVVERVIDGDTIEVLDGGVRKKVRLVGVDTPETVHPQKPVEYFGKEASVFTKTLLEGSNVYLVHDQADKPLDPPPLDKYGRELAYVFRVRDLLFVNLEIVKLGYGFAYTKYPFQYMELFRYWEQKARGERRGLWSDEATAEAGGAEAASDPSRGPPEATAPAADEGENGTAKPEDQIVYVTASGGKYHRDGCRYLAKSKIAKKLGEASKSFGACSVCGPPTLAVIVPKKDGETKPAEKKEEPKDISVYGTKTGTKYHRAGCRYLSKSMIPIGLKEAKARYSPCSVCGPP